MTTDVKDEPNMLVIGVLALQGAFHEHIMMLKEAIQSITQSTEIPATLTISFHILEVRTPSQLDQCDALIIPGGESTAISLVAERSSLLEPLRQFVKVQRKPVWGTCAGLILLAEQANRTKQNGQELIGGLDVRVNRNYFGRQTESFEAELDLGFLSPASTKFRCVFIRAPVVEKILDQNDHSPSDEIITSTMTGSIKSSEHVPVKIMATLPATAKSIRDEKITAESIGEAGDIVAVQQNNIFGTSFHPELTGDARIHIWWLKTVVGAIAALNSNA